jgi:serine/threonine-protein kinase
VEGEFSEPSIVFGDGPVGECRDAQESGQAPPAAVVAFSLHLTHISAFPHGITVTTIDSPLADSLRDRYLLERELGRGGMATVYLARDLRHDRSVALKVLHQELAHALGPERFVREIKVAARLQHPHILPVFDSGTAKQPGSSAESLWFTMPYVAGESLRQRLAREPQLPLQDAVHIALEVADALGYAHGQGIVHRDVKPENILLSGEHCVIADFGVAQALEVAGGERLTETGITFGTPLYMSPEQASAERRLDGRSDIYSLGCVFYEMLAGEPPFTGRSAQAILARRLSEPVPHLRTLREVPESVEEVVAKALARSPADRFVDTSQFARALQAAVGAQPARPTAPAARPPAFRRRLLAAAGALVGVAVLLGRYRGFARAPEVTLDRNLLAIAPFDVLDPSLQLWREGLGDILSRSLDGAGPLRTVSPTVALRGWQGRADGTSAEALGRRTGAGLVVFGTMVPKGRDSVTIRAGVLDAMSGSGQREVEVSGGSARIGELADSLGIRILQALGGSRAIGSVRQVSMGSRSLAAVKSFLQGEQFYRRGVWDSALARYDQAIAADSTFALAMSRMKWVLYWYPHTRGAYLSPDKYARRSTLYNHGLSPRESLLIAADSFSFAAEAATDPAAFVGFHFRSHAAHEEAVRRYPGDPEAWYVLGEARMHSPFPIGTPPATVVETFSRAIALDSGFAPAYEHMPGLLLSLGQPQQAQRFAAAYLRLYPDAGSASTTRLVLLLLAQAGAVDTARLVDSASVRTINDAVDILALVTDSAETQVRLLRKMGDPHRSAGTDVAPILDSLMWPQYLAKALAYRGHLHEAYRTNRRLLLDPAASKWSPIWDPFLDLALLGILPDSIAGPVFARALDPATPWEADLPRHLNGITWWLAHRDTLSLRRFAARAAAETRRPSPPPVILQARLLRATATAYAALARGDSAKALTHLEAIPDTLCFVDFASECFHLNLTLARLLAARGDDRRAGALLERWRWSAGANNGPSPWFVLAILERGRVADRLGERETAIESYRFVTEAWRRPDPELQPYVTEAREALARLARRE